MPSVFVPGEAAPQGSAKGFAMQSKKTGKYRAVITHANKNTMPWRKMVEQVLVPAIGDLTPIDGPVSVDLEFVIKRRVAEPKRVTPPHTRKPDLDKLTRAILDAMSGIVYVDDNRVVELRATKRTARIGEEPGVTIRWESEQDA